MGNMTDYVRREQRGFDELAFNEVDALVLAQLAYEDVPLQVGTLADLTESYGTLSKRLHAFDPRRPLASSRMLAHAPFPTLTLADVDQLLHGPSATQTDDGQPGTPDDSAGNGSTNGHSDHSDNEPDAITPHAHIFNASAVAHQVHISNFADPKLVHDLHRAAAASPRFAAVTLGAFSKEFDAQRQTQFAAVTYRLNDQAGTLVVAFRGTDDTLVGWKEDFNMSFQYPVPAQRQASVYLRALARLWPGPIILTGHSKGGNLAVNAAMNAPESVSARIKAVYSLDGPGFPNRVVSSEPYAAIRGRVTKIVPESTIIGMILQTPDPCEVVASEASGLMQHFPFSWQVEGHAFVRCAEMSAASQAFNHAINEWLTTLTPEQCEHAVDALFSVLGAGGAKTFAELVASLPMSIPAILGRAMALAPGERKHIGESLRILLTAATAKPTDAPVTPPDETAGQ